MGTMAFQITSLTIVYSTVYSGTYQRKHQSSASLAFVWGIHVTGEFPAQMASNAENISIWWRHHVEPMATTKPTTVACTSMSLSMETFELNLFTACAKQILQSNFILIMTAHEAPPVCKKSHLV